MRAHSSVRYRCTCRPEEEPSDLKKGPGYNWINAVYHGEEIANKNTFYPIDV